MRAIVDDNITDADGTLLNCGTLLWIEILREFENKRKLHVIHFDMFQFGY